MSSPLHARTAPPRSKSFSSVVVGGREKYTTEIKERDGEEGKGFKTFNGDGIPVRNGKLHSDTGHHGCYHVRTLPCYR